MSIKLAFFCAAHRLTAPDNDKQIQWTNIDGPRLGAERNNGNSQSFNGDIFQFSVCCLSRAINLQQSEKKLAFFAVLGRLR